MTTESINEEESMYGYAAVESGEPVRTTVTMNEGTTLQYSFNEGKLVINQFASGGLTFQQLRPGTSVEADFKSVFDDQHAAFYGAPVTDEAIARRVAIWGGRAENGSTLSAFVAYDKNNTVVGYANLGLSNIQGGLEGGMIHRQLADATTHPVAMIHAVYLDYPYIVQDNKLGTDVGSAPYVLYTVSSTNPLAKHLQASDLTQFNLSEAKTDVEQACLYNMLSSTTRFSFNEEQNLVCEGAGKNPCDIPYAKEVFFHFFDLSACAPLDATTAPAHGEL